MTKNLHHYSAAVEWTGNTGLGTKSYSGYKRDYNILISGKKTIEGSSDPAFLGDDSKPNPEELLLASISSCHMLWYLHLCANESIVVVKYIDNASGVMETYNNCSGRFIEVVLNPIVTISDVSQGALAESLHARANSMCFIANSLNFSVRHNPKILQAD